VPSGGIFLLRFNRVRPRSTALVLNAVTAHTLRVLGAVSGLQGGRAIKASLTRGSI
jgi:hypothetical protein